MRTRLLAAAAALGVTAGTAAAEPFTFVALGDMPYGAPDEVFPPFEALIETVNESDPAFVLHIGDTKSGSTPCTDEMLKAQLDYMNSFASPTIYTPGDNEWTDCYRKDAGAFDSLERLDHIRSTYFTEPSMSFGQERMEVESQAEVMAGEYPGFPENVRFARDGIHVIAAHVLGSNNNFEVRDPDAAMEFFTRDTASTAWLVHGFDEAIGADAKAVVLAIHADMFELGFNEFGKEGFIRHSGFKNFGETLVAKANEFGKPVLVVYGDSHVFQFFRPFRETAPTIWALEVFGAEHMHAVEVTADPDDPAVFAVRPILNPALDTAM